MDCDHQAPLSMEYENGVPEMQQMVCVCMCVLVAQSCLTLCDSVDYRLSGSSVPGIPQARMLTRVGCHFLLQRIFPTQGWNPGLLNCKQILYHLSHQGSPNEVIYNLGAASKD